LSGRAGVVCGSSRVDGLTCEHGSGVGPASTRWPLASSLVLGALDTAPSCARLHASSVLHEWGLADLAETAELIVSELVTNAVQASTEPAAQPQPGLPVVHLRLLADRFRVIVEVWDGNPQAPTLKETATDQEHGRGLMLIDALCERWGSEAVPSWGGKVLWAELQRGR